MATQRKRIIIGLGIGLMVTLMGGWWFIGAQSRSLTWRDLAQSRYDRHILTATLAGRSWQLEVVNSPASTSQGLSGRDQIGADGMLFIFPKLGQLSFWMKEMKFNLDMIWLAEGKVVDITAHVPAPAATTPLEQLPRYGPTQPSDGVLEIPAGQAELWGIKPGDVLEVHQP